MTAIVRAMQMSAYTGKQYSMTAPVVATPLPPLKRKKTGQLWPMTQHRPARREAKLHTGESKADPVINRAAQQASSPLTASKKKVMMPYF